MSDPAVRFRRGAASAGGRVRRVALAVTLGVVLAAVVASVFAVGVWFGDRQARLELQPDFETVTQERIWQNGRRCVLWRLTDRYGTHYLAVGDCRIAERVDK